MTRTLNRCLLDFKLSVYERYACFCDARAHNNLIRPCDQSSGMLTGAFTRQRGASALVSFVLVKVLL